MMIVMKREATEEQIQAVCEAIHEHGMESLVLPGGQRVSLSGIPSAIPPELRPVLDQHLSAMDGVDQVIHISRPVQARLTRLPPARYGGAGWAYGNWWRAVRRDGGSLRR
jgi:hypothetical protein